MTKSKKKKLNDVVDKHGLHSFDKEVEVLPDNVKEWAGLFGKNGSFSDEQINSDNEYASLASMNDLGCSFKEIAKTIEKEWENL